jgi:hypothetical protein
LFWFGFPVWDVWYLLSYPLVMFVSDSSEPMFSRAIEELNNPALVWERLYWFGLGYLAIALAIGAFAFRRGIRVRLPLSENNHLMLGGFLFFAVLLFGFQLPAFAVDGESGIVSTCVVLVMALICMAPLVLLGQAFVQSLLLLLKLDPK